MPSRTSFLSLLALIAVGALVWFGFYRPASDLKADPSAGTSIGRPSDQTNPQPLDLTPAQTAALPVPAGKTNADATGENPATVSSAQAAAQPVEVFLDAERWADAQKSILQSPMTTEGFSTEDFLKGFCQRATRKIDWSASLPRQRIPTRQSAITSVRWLAERVAQPCQGVRPPPAIANVAELDATLALRQTDPSLFNAITMFPERAPKDLKIVDANVRHFIRIARTYSEISAISGVIDKMGWQLGAELFTDLEATLQPNYHVRAQKIAIHRLACDQTTLCGPEKYQSLRSCSHHLVCRPGITVAEVARLTNPDFVIEASEVIYQELLKIRRGR